MRSNLLVPTASLITAALSLTFFGAKYGSSNSKPNNSNTKMLPDRPLATRCMIPGSSRS